MSEHEAPLNEIKRVKHWNRTFAVGDIIWSERHMALGKIDRIFLNSIDRDHYAEVIYDNYFDGSYGRNARSLKASDPLNTMRHATLHEIAVHEAMKALEL